MNLKKLEDLIKLVERSAINELEIGRMFGRKIRVVKVAASPAASPAAAPVPAYESKKEPPEKNRQTIKSPMVGTFYRAPAPDAQPYVEVGDTVKPGQVVCIIEAMKLMNEIEAETPGRVVEILVKNEQPIQFGQVLFVIEPL